MTIVFGKPEKNVYSKIIQIKYAMNLKVNLPEQAHWA